MTDEKKITVLTATLNADRWIERLIESLRRQTDTDFEWLVIDGCSTDSTLALVNSIRDLNVRCIVERDFGIYDALNRGIEAIDSGYYLVVGADDTLHPQAIELYKEAISFVDADIVTTSVIQDNKVVRPRQRLGWLFGLPGVAGNHAVGMLLNIGLHSRFGLYSRKFPIAADQYFVKMALKGGAKIAYFKFIAGTFSNEGTSGSDPVGLLTDVFRVQLLTERFIAPQYLLFFLRLAKLYLFSSFRLIDYRFSRKNTIIEG